MLAIRLQRTGRSGRAHYRMIVQDARKSPKSGKIVTSLGDYNPHSKSLIIDKEKADLFIKNGAQPSPRVARLLKESGHKLPDWVSVAPTKERTIRNSDKLRRNRPAGAEAPQPSAEVPAEEPAEAVTAEAEAPAESPEVVVENPVTEATASESTAEEPEAPAEDTTETTEESAEPAKEA